MRKRVFLLFLILFISAIHLSTFGGNGSQFIGVGPVSRSMGGASISNPLSVDSAIYGNPATLGFFHELEAAAGLSVMFGFQKGGIGSTEPSADEKTFAPSIGFLIPVSDVIHIGLGFMQTGKIETDYRATGNADNVNARLRQFEIIPALSINCKFLFLGFSFPITYQVFHFSTQNYAASASPGPSDDLGISVKVGVAFEVKKILRMGLIFKTPSLLSPKHSRALINSTGGYNDFSIAPPGEYGLGISLLMFSQWVISIEGKFIQWSSADGYSDLGWKDQVIAIVGVQYKPMPQLSLRFGANFGTSVVKEQNGWLNAGTTVVQGITMANRDFHALRTFGLLAGGAIHFTAGFGYDLSRTMQLNFAALFELPTSSVTDTNSAGVSYTGKSTALFSINVGVSLLL